MYANNVPIDVISASLPPTGQLMGFTYILTVIKAERKNAHGQRRHHHTSIVVPATGYPVMSALFTRHGPACRQLSRDVLGVGLKRMHIRQINLVVQNCYCLTQTNHTNVLLHRLKWLP